MGITGPETSRQVSANDGQPPRTECMRALPVCRMSRPSLEVIAFQPAQVDEPGMVLGMAAQQLRAMPPVLHALLGCCDDAHTGVRKAAVLGLAELWYLLGHR